MSTLNQQKAASLVLENLGNPIKKKKKASMGAILAEAGYKPSIVKNPQMVTESKGFKEALGELGLTEELIATSLVDDIKAKPKRRFLELSLGAEILGMKKHDPQKGDNKTVINILNFNTFNGNGDNPTV